MRNGLLLVAISALLIAPTAAAHAQLLSSDPQNGARLDAVPSQVVIRLTEAIEESATTIHATDATGVVVDGGPVSIVGGEQPTLTLPLKAGLPDGVYRVAWKVFSKDTHTVTGSIAFAVGSFNAEPAQQASTGGLDPVAAVSRAAIYAGYASVFGAALFLLIGPPALQRQYRLGALAGSCLHAAGMLGLILYTAKASGLGFTAFGASDVGRNMEIRLAIGGVAFVAAAFATRSRRILPALVAPVLLVLAAGLNASVSHSIKAYGAPIADFTHLLAAALWVGGVVALMLSLRLLTDATTVRRLGARFGLVAISCVFTVFATGTIVSWVLITAETGWTWSGVLGSTWGLALMGKILLALVMIAVAALNRYVFLEPATDEGLAGILQRGSRAVSHRLTPLPDSLPVLRRAVAFEAILGVLVIILAGSLTSVSPPAAEQLAPQLTTLRAQGEYFLVHATFEGDPIVGTTSDIKLNIVDAESGVPVSNNTCGRESCVTISLTYGNGTEPDNRVALPHGTGTWFAHSIVWTRPGPAQIVVNISTQDHFLDAIQMKFEVKAG